MQTRSRGPIARSADVRRELPSTYRHRRPLALLKFVGTFDRELLQETLVALVATRTRRSFLIACYRTGQVFDIPLLWTGARADRAERVAEAAADRKNLIRVMPA